VEYRAVVPDGNIILIPLKANLQIVVLGNEFQDCKFSVIVNVEENMRRLTASFD
jgi:hypothetical protein